MDSFSYRLGRMLGKQAMLGDALNSGVGAQVSRSISGMGGPGPGKNPIPGAANPVAMPPGTQMASPTPTLGASRLSGGVNLSSARTNPVGANI